MLLDFNHVKLVVVAWLIPYCFHIHYLATAPRFDYGWNMTYNIIHVVVQTIIISVWWYRVRKARRNAWKSLAFVRQRVIRCLLLLEVEVACVILLEVCRVQQLLSYN